MALQIRRGLSAELTSTFVPLVGEPILTLDTQKLYFGDGVSTADNLTPINKDLQLADLADVYPGASNPIPGYVLAYDAITAWTPVEVNLNFLADVEIVSSIIDGEVLRADGDFTSPTYGKYVNAKLNITDLGDLSISSPSDGETLVYSSTSGTWENQVISGGGGSSTLDGLTDVTITSASDGQALVYEAASGLWKNQTLSGGGALALNDLTNVNAAAPNSGDVLVYDGVSSTWLTAAPSGGGGGGLNSRTSASGTTVSIADGSSDTITIAVAKTYALHKIQTSAAAWVTVYTDSSSATADSSRGENTDPAPGSGVIAEAITTSASVQQLTPGVIGFDNESVPTGTINLKVVNKSGTAQAITVTLYFVALEA